jgi:hypothetical protein
MDSDDPDAPWRRHTERFLPRAVALGATTFAFAHPFIAQVPALPLKRPLGDAASIKLQLCLMTIGSLRTAREIAFSCGKLWLQGHFLMASVGARMLVELQGQLSWAQAKVLVPQTSGKIDVAHPRMVKLIFGANTAIPLIRGETGPHPLINVMEFIRAAEASQPGAADDYAFLCDGAHPSFMLQSWLLFAGPDHDNWTNATFAAQTDAILERVLATAERALAQVEAVASVLFSECLPEIAAETAAWHPSDA